MPNYNPCAMCKKTDKPTYYGPSRSSLVFGWNKYTGVYTMEYRCAKCELKLCKELNSIHTECV